MKWFKHYTDASMDAKICELEDEFGYIGYGVYWKILEYCAMQWDGKSEPIFIINRRKVRQLFRINSTKTELIFTLCSTLNLFSVKTNEKQFIIEIPNLLIIKDNHTKNLQATSKKVSKNLPLEQNRTDKNRTDKITNKKLKSKFDLEKIYNAYPKKVGKAVGIKKLTEQVKTEDDFLKALSGAENYAEYHKRSETDPQYIKLFSTWCNQECWEDVLDIPESQAEMDARHIKLLGGE
jgi:hypothetical protein